MSADKPEPLKVDPPEYDYIEKKPRGKSTAAALDRMLAETWDEGYATCLGDFDISARAEARSDNPYRAND